MTLSVGKHGKVKDPLLACWLGFALGEQGYHMGAENQEKLSVLYYFFFASSGLFYDFPPYLKKVTWKITQ